MFSITLLAENLRSNNLSESVFEIKTIKMGDEYKKKLENFIKDVPKLGLQINSGASVVPAFPKWRERFAPVAKAVKDANDRGDTLTANRLLGGFETEIRKELPTNDLFFKYTQTHHSSLILDWLGGGIRTTCNEFVHWCGRAMGIPDNFGRFKLYEYLQKIGKGDTWVAASSGKRPGYGDIFKANRLHMAISLGFHEDGDWLTVESGQGGSTSGFDILKRKKQKFDATDLEGWCSMAIYFREPMPDWLVGLWVIYCGDQTYFYKINNDYTASYYPWKPMGIAQNAIATDTGTVELQGSDFASITWSKEGGTEKFKYDRFESFPKIMEKMSGTSSRGEKLKGVRL